MRAGEIAMRALLGLAISSPETPVSPNPGAVVARQSGCDVGQTECGAGCMPIGSACCASYVIKDGFEPEETLKLITNGVIGLAVAPTATLAIIVCPAQAAARYTPPSLFF